MRPVVTVEEMRAADEAARTAVPEAELIRRAGTAVAHQALSMLDGAYGRRVTVLAGKGNNGADGRVAAAVLTRRGARVRVLEAGVADLAPCDLVIDAAYGTGFRGTFEAPAMASGQPVLAVDIPSGIDGDTGASGGRPMAARRTVTFAALKPGLLQGDGPGYAGQVVTADIGIAVGSHDVGLVEDVDVAALVARRPHGTNKWKTAVAVVAGSPGMEGAAALCAHGAARAGAGMVRLAVPGSARPGGDVLAGPWPIEAVRLPLPAEGWADEVLSVLGRCRCLVVGPGLGRGADTVAQVRRLVARSPVPVVADADALFALGRAVEAAPVVAGEGVARRVVLTPHDGEYERLMGEAPGPDRIAAARRLATATGAASLLKGPLTAVADPGPPGPVPRVWLSDAGSPRLATAGTGDVLSGVIGAFLARGVADWAAPALGAHVHGRAAGAGSPEGLVAPDLPDLVAGVLSRIVGDAEPSGPDG
ncbi:MAG TPA: bifunctional ADP-dependent NAD(P)H-hydrate dehydratase/NAD(P)H-hydrate epimerase [Acidimicrobiales bacterium]|nr:bifunctional ADP-dependent NAD(P)H-hydrate dehydratase/NAD(P)H-hydrate epimerase [Acidimicrobiales bacterium]